MCFLFFLLPVSWVGMEADPSSRIRKKCWMVDEHTLIGASRIVSTIPAYPSPSGGLLGKVGDAVPELGFADAVGGYDGGVHDAEDD